jgi:hypothetical protein
MIHIGDTYSAADVLNKTLIAKKKVYTYTTPSATRAQLIGHVKAGGPVGVVYSYIQNASGLWWMFRSGTATYYVLHRVGLFDISSFAAQGLLTIEAQDEAEKISKMNFLQKMGYDLKKWDTELSSSIESTGKKILIFAGVGLAIFMIAKREISGTGSIARSLKKIVR